MQKQPSSKMILEYRHYNLPVNFPVIALLEHRFRFPIERVDDVNFMHLHNCIEIGCCSSGGGTLRVEGKSIDYGGGDLCIVPPFATHITYRDTTRGQNESAQVEYLYIDIKKLLEPYFPSGLPLLADFQYDFPEFPNVLHGEEHPRLRGLTLSMLDLMREEPEHYQEEFRALAAAFAFELWRLLPSSVRAGGAKTQRPQLLSLAPAIEFVNENYGQPLTPQELAGLCHMSLTNFRRIFRRTMGTSPMEYLHRVRVYKAQLLLFSTELTVLEISLQTGFESISSFNRHFMQVVGETPSGWRKRNRSIQKKDLHYSEFSF